MIQYLQSWFPGWGGWYGDVQDPNRPEELLTSPSTWDILGKNLYGGVMLFTRDQIFSVYNINVLW